MHLAASKKSKSHAPSFVASVDRIEASMAKASARAAEKYEAECQEEERKWKAGGGGGGRGGRRGLKLNLNRTGGAAATENFVSALARPSAAPSPPSSPNSIDAEFHSNIADLLSPPRLKPKAAALSTSGKVSRFMRNTKKMANGAESDDSSEDGVLVTDFVDDDSYRRRVADVVVVDQLLAARQITAAGKVRRKKNKPTLADRMKDSHAVHRYTESMKLERESYHSVALLCEARLQELAAQAGAEAGPDEYRTAIICDILLTLTPVFGR